VKEERGKRRRVVVFLGRSDCEGDCRSSRHLTQSSAPLGDISLTFDHRPVAFTEYRCGEGSESAGGGEKDGWRGERQGNGKEDEIRKERQLRSSKAAASEFPSRTDQDFSL